MPLNYPPQTDKPKFVQFLQNQQMPTINYPAGAGPNAQFQNDDRVKQQESLARALMGQGLDPSPTQGGWGEGLARVGQALLGAYMTKKADDKEAAIRDENSQALQNALEKGDVGGLLTSGNDLAEKLGASLLEKQMTPKTSYRTLTPDEVAKAGYPSGAVVQEDSNGRQYLTARPPNNAGLPGGYRWNADHTGWEPIPGGPADPTAAGKLAAARRAPPKANPATLAIGGDEPWNQKW
jgi:hypothetical protein